MKTLHLGPCPRALALLAALAATVLRAEDNGLDINVRTTVELPPGKSLSAHPTFVMLPAIEIASPEKLVRPVPEKTITAVHQLLQEKLQAQGYVGVTDKVRPEILITVQYGRGYLPNPYTLGKTTSEVPSASPPSGKMSGETGRSVTARGVDVDYFKHHAFNYESKAQLAAQEKLFVTIAAWDFASMQKGTKRVRYWTTTVLVDDPDHRDLNQIYDQMISASAEFFNRQLKHEEVEISTKVREGRVEVGIPKVVDEESPKK